MEAGTPPRKRLVSVCATYLLDNVLETPKRFFSVPIMSRQRDIWRQLLAQFSLDPEQLKIREIVINGTRWNNHQTTLGECLDIEKDDGKTRTYTFELKGNRCVRRVLYRWPSRGHPEVALPCPI